MTVYRCMCINLNTKAKASKGNDGVQMYVSELITAQSRSIHEMVLAPVSYTHLTLPTMAVV